MSRRPPEQPCVSCQLHGAACSQSAVAFHCCSACMVVSNPSTRVSPCTSAFATLSASSGGTDGCLGGRRPGRRQQGSLPRTRLPALLLQSPLLCLLVRWSTHALLLGPLHGRPDPGEKRWKACQCASQAPFCCCLPPAASASPPGTPLGAGGRQSTGVGRLGRHARCPRAARAAACAAGGRQPCRSGCSWRRAAAAGGRRACAVGARMTQRSSLPAAL